jgi:hypothetical protein
MPGALAFALAVGGCTTPVYDEQKFEASATHIDRAYRKPMDKVYGCFVEKDVAPVGLKHLFQTYAFADNAYYGWKGLVAVRFRKTSTAETAVRISLIQEGGGNIPSEKLLTALDVCGAG